MGVEDSELKPAPHFVRKSMPDPPKQIPVEKATLAVLKGGPEYVTWFHRLRDQTRLPAALLLDAALVEFARAKGFDEPPPR
jgi:hypothetical protein